MYQPISTHVQQYPSNPWILGCPIKQVYSNFKYYQIYLKLCFVVQILKIVKCEILTNCLFLILNHPCVYSSGYEP